MFGEIEDAEGDVARLVAFEVGQQVRKHRLDAALGDGSKHVDRKRLGQQLHPEQLVRQRARVNQHSQEHRGVDIEPRNLAAELEQIVAHRVEMARLVERLAGRRHFGFDVVEAFREVSRDDPGGQLTPQDDREDPRERTALVRLDLDSTVTSQEICEDFLPVPRARLCDLVEALELGEFAAGLGNVGFGPELIRRKRKQRRTYEFSHHMNPSCRASIGV